MKFINLFKKYNNILLIILLIITLIIIHIGLQYNDLYENFQTNSKNLVYYTHGFNNNYLDLLELSIKSLRLHNNNDVVVICSHMGIYKDEIYKMLITINPDVILM